MVPDAARRYVLLVSVAVVGYWLAPVGAWRVTMQLLVGLCTAVTVLVAVRADRAHRTGWVVFAVGVALFYSGDAAAAWYLLRRQPIPFPSVMDAFNLASFWVMAMAITQLRRERRERLKNHGRDRNDLAGSLDAAVLTVAGGLVLWVAFAVPVHGELNTPEVIALAYPLSTTVLLGCIIRLWLTPNVTLPSSVVQTLLLGTSVELVGDVLYGLTNGSLRACLIRNGTPGSA